MTLGMVMTLRYNTKGQSLRETICKLDFIKIKNSCPAKHTVERMRRQAHGGTYSQNTSLIKDRYPKYIKNIVTQQ